MRGRPSTAAGERPGPRAVQRRPRAVKGGELWRRVVNGGHRPCLVAEVNPDAAPDPLTEHVLQTFAREAGLARESLHLDMRAEELGLGSLDLTLVLFELEDKLGIRLPDFPDGAQQMTLRELIAQAQPKVAAAEASSSAGAATA